MYIHNNTTKSQPNLFITGEKSKMLPKRLNSSNNRLTLRPDFTKSTRTRAYAAQRIADSRSQSRAQCAVHVLVHAHVHMRARPGRYRRS